MIPILKKIGLTVVSLIGVCFWLLPPSVAAGFLLTLAMIGFVVFLLCKQMGFLTTRFSSILRFRYVGSIVFAIGIALPLIVDEFELRLYSELLILGLLAMSLDIMMGFIGLASFAHAALSGISAYTVAILLTKASLHPWLSILAAVIVGTLATTVMGAFSVRVRDIYFGIITLVFGSVFFIIANSWVSLTNGEDGITVDLPVLNFLWLFRVDSSNLVHFWYLCLGTVFVSYVLLRQVMRSSIGLVFQGIRENEERTSYVGYNVNQFKILATAISGFFASLSGVLTLLKSGIIGTEQMDALHSGEVVIWSIIGGLGTLIGPLFGASFVHLLIDFLTEYTERYLLIIGLIFIVIILLAPRGIVGTLSAYWRAASGENRT